MRTSPSAVDGLKRARPEWTPWLAVIEKVLRETTNRAWDAAVPVDPGERQADAPFLAGAGLSVESRLVRDWFLRLIRVAASGGTSKMRTLEAALDRSVDVLTVFAASLCHDTARMNEIADRYGADNEALRAVVALVPVPFLQACNRRWAASMRQSWTHAYCPLCGSWPAFAEVRGIERDRYFRCGRCGAEWHARALCCAYCGMHDHNELVALAPEKNDLNAVIEACNRCLGYIKTFSRLQGCPAGAVIVEDLASVALDVAALDQGYTRPDGSGYRFDVTVTENGARRRFFAWNT